MTRDNVFADKKDKVEPFCFNETVTRVFDDMLARSVPFYHESIRRQAQMTADFYQPGSLVYDLGCSNGNLGLNILDEMDPTPFSMIAVDSSRPMIDTYAERIRNRPDKHKVNLVCGLLENLKFDNMSVALINLTLQFLSPESRDELIGRIFKGLRPGGILLLTEKVEHMDKDLNALQLKYYKAFKKENGYSDLEISQKRDALEKVLIPDTIETHFNRLNSAGFTQVDIWLKWFNFASIIAVK